jgi:hypothetical protein
VRVPSHASLATGGLISWAVAVASYESGTGHDLHLPTVLAFRFSQFNPTRRLTSLRQDANGEFGKRVYILKMSICSIGTGRIHYTARTKTPAPRPLITQLGSLRLDNVFVKVFAQGIARDLVFTYHYQLYFLPRVRNRLNTYRKQAVRSDMSVTN